MKKNLLHINEIRFLIIHIILINHWNINLFFVNVPYNHNIFNFGFDLTSPCLAIISGYLFFYKTKEHLNYSKKIHNRLHSLVIPYVIWSVSFFFIYELMKITFQSVFHETIWYMPRQPFTFMSVLKDLINPPLGNFWYLQNLVFIIPFNFIIYYLLRNKYVFIAVLLAVIACYSFERIYPFNHINLFFQPRFLPYYLLGCFFGYNEIVLPTIPIKKWTAWVLVPLLTAIAVCTSPWQDNVFPFLFIKLFIAVFFLITVFNLLDSNQNGIVFNYLKKYQGYSFFLFAINQFLFTLVQRISFKLGAAQYLKYDAFMWSFLIASAIVVVVLTFLIAGFLKNRFGKFFYVITGR